MYASIKTGIAVWRDSPHVCALSDDERHLGHIVKDREWIAFDAIHASETGEGMLQLGSFSSAVSAKEAVERSVGVDRQEKASHSSAAATSIQ